ncbi:MAG: PAS domain S-box protein [Bacteroidales bacterium]|nr:PAS domain S-box protein [Bacteroidales bacterium]
MEKEDSDKRIAGDLVQTSNEKWFKTLVENSAQGLLVATRYPLQIIYASPAMETISGYTPLELTSLTSQQINELVHPDDRELFFVRFDRALSAGLENRRNVYRIIDKSGVIKWFELFPSIIMIGNIKAVQGTLIDITARKTAELKLSENEKRYRTLINLAPDAFFHGDDSGNFIDVNRNSSVMTGYSRKELLGMNIVQLYAPEDLQKNPLRYDKIKRGITVTTERIVMRKDGTRFVAEMKSLMMPDQTYISLFRDISGRKSLEQELIAARIKAEESDKLKTEFLNNMSHEIRTPLNAIIGFSTLLAEDDGDESEKMLYRSIIEESGNQLMMIISDIIDISKIEAGQIIISKSEINLNQIIDQLHSTFRHSPQLRVSLTAHKALPDENATLVSDRYRLIQIFSNLISNAIKFTVTGEISFGYSEVSEKSIECFVKDTGKGIDPRFHHEIFDRFRQIQPDGSLTSTGTGLGLAIAKGLVSMLGGTIGVDSDVNRGSIFRFTLPVSRKK